MADQAPKPSLLLNLGFVSSPDCTIGSRIAQELKDSAQKRCISPVDKTAEESACKLDSDVMPHSDAPPSTAEELTAGILQPEPRDGTRAPARPPRLTGSAKAATLEVPALSPSATEQEFERLKAQTVADAKARLEEAESELQAFQRAGTGQGRTGRHSDHSDAEHKIITDQEERVRVCEQEWDHALFMQKNQELEEHCPGPDAGQARLRSLQEKIMQCKLFDGSMEHLSTRCKKCTARHAAKTGGSADSILPTIEDLQCKNCSKQLHKLCDQADKSVKVDPVSVDFRDL